MRFLYLFIFILLIISIGCKGDEKTPDINVDKSDLKEETITPSQKVKVADTASFEATLTASEKKGLQQIGRKYAAEIKLLRDQKEWTGSANRKTRVNLNNRRNAEIKNLLGSKYQAYLADLKLKRAQKASNK